MDLYSQLKQYERGQATKFPTSGTIAGIDGGNVDVSVRGSSSIIRHVKCVGSPTSNGQLVVLTWENGVPTAHITGGGVASTDVALIRGPQGLTGPQGPAGAQGTQGLQGPTGSVSAASSIGFTELASKPANPAAGMLSVYAKTDHKVYKLASDGTETELGKPVRELLTTDRTYYVSPTGSDSNNGLTAGAPFATIQKAVNTVASLDIGTYNVTIQLANGTYTAGATVSSWIGSGTVTIQGNASNPALVVLSTTGTHCINTAGVIPTALILKDMKLQAASGGNCINHVGTGLVRILGINFGSCPGAYHIFADGPTAQLQKVGPCSISGNAAAHIGANAGSYVLYQTDNTWVGTSFAFSFVFVYCTRLSIVFCTSAWNLNGITVAGSRFMVDTNAVIHTNGAGVNYFPGNSSGGTVSSGGQYL